MTKPKKFDTKDAHALGFTKSSKFQIRKRPTAS